MNITLLRFDLVAHLYRQREFSARTFGPGARTAGVRIVEACRITQGGQP